MQERDDEFFIKREEVLSKIRTYKKPIHPDFAWWKEREGVRERYSNNYRYVRSNVTGEAIAPPEDILRKLDQFESLLAWLENKSIGQEMTAYEKAQVVLKLVEMTSSHELSVSLESDSFDVNLKGDRMSPVWTNVQGAGNYSDPLEIKITKED